MEAVNVNIQLSFKQLVEIIKQLPQGEKEKLSKVLIKETHTIQEHDAILTHLASEKVLSKDWLSPEEDEAWKDL